MWLGILVAIVSILFFIKFLFTQDSSNEKRKNEIPGPRPSDPGDGNKPDIVSMHKKCSFIRQLHDKYGPIVSFWEGKQFCVSVSSADLFKEVRHMSAIPKEVFMAFEVVTGPSTFSFCPMEELLRRRKIYDKHFMMTACRSFSHQFVELSKEVTAKWKKTEGTPFELLDAMTRCSLTAVLRTSFGEYYKDDAHISSFKTLIEYILTHVEVPEGTEERKELLAKSAELKSLVMKLMDNRKKSNEEGKTKERLFIDVLLEEDLPEDARTADCTMFIGSGYFTTAVSMTWFLYELARNEDVQEKILQELQSKIGDSELTIDNIQKLSYLRQAVDESLRLYLQPMYTARITEEDMTLGGYDVPKGTTIYLALGRLLTNPTIWENHDKFDPDRFSPEQNRTRQPYNFKPFGFAGKRICPGQVFAYTKMMICCAEWIRNFRFNLVPGQDIHLTDDILMMPDKEIMVTVQRRV